MRPCSEASHRSWISWLLGFTSFLLSICSSGVKSSEEHVSTVNGSGVHVPVKGIQGGSVLLYMENLRIDPGHNLTEVTWSFYKPVKRKILHLNPTNHIQWYKPEDKQRFCVLNKTFMRIENLTLEDTGLYEGEVTLTGGKTLYQVFHLTVYEPVPTPQILAQPEAITTDWCNVTLECIAKGVTEILNVTWESKDITMEHKIIPGPAPNLWALAVTLPLSKPNSSLICKVSNQVDQKNTTIHLVEVCPSPSRKRHSRIIIMIIFVLILSIGLCLWKTCWKKKIESRRDAQRQVQNNRNEDGIPYAEIIHPESQERHYETIGQKQESYTTVYSKVCHEGQSVRIT